MTPQEEKLVLELQSRWGNRWSRIAKKLPGRTDNEIKNYWRTHIRKVSQEKKRTVSLPSSSSPALKDPKVDSITMKASGAESFYDTGGPEPSSSTEIKSREVGKKTEHAMDDIWGEIALSEEDAITPANEYCGESLWETQGEECKMLPRSTDSLFSCYAELEYLR
ncbi:hypothetical protein SAY87_016305 [Trapa incisa]|nr:hypothetical protein SAY87_016305 [Trapa incisa]